MAAWFFLLRLLFLTKLDVLMVDDLHSLYICSSEITFMASSIRINGMNSHVFNFYSRVCKLYTGWVKKSRPPTTFNDIFTWAESFCIKFYTLIGNLYPRMCTNFRLFILTFNEMALILLRPPIIFTVSSLDCSAGNKNADYQLNGNDAIGQWCRLDCRLS